MSLLQQPFEIITMHNYNLLAMPKASKNQIARCNRCGSCLAVCPVYGVSLIEALSPRGKVALAHHVMEGKCAFSPHLKEILSQCLLCGSCQKACPSGVQGSHIFTELKRESLRNSGANWRTLLMAKLLTAPRPLENSIRFARLARDIMESLSASSGRGANLNFSHLPRFSRPFFRERIPPVSHPAGKPRGVALYFYGCSTNFLFAQVGEAVVRTLLRDGWEVHVPREQVCCGIPVLMSGNYEQALFNVERNVDLLTAFGSDVVVTDCATCGLAFTQEYPHLLEVLGRDAKKAFALAEKVRDITELLVQRGSGHDLACPSEVKKLRVTYHDPCHLAKGRNIRQEPRMLLRSLPHVDYVEMEMADACCGGGGAFQFEHPELSGRITELKIAHILETGAQVVASGCPSCRLTLKKALKNKSIRVCHPVELVGDIDEA
jgi:glycolate oxidase iron-sulfur subunit